MSSQSLPSTSDWGYHPPKVAPDELVAAVAAAAKAALQDYRSLPDGPEPCADAEGYFRVNVEIALPTTLADQLMNGPTGYRAHYSICAEAGERFNRQLVEAIAPLVIEAEHLYRSRFCRRFCTRSLLGQFSKFWYPKQLTDPSSQADLLAFNEVLRLPRWLNYWRTRPKPHKGLLAPISEASSILLNGTFVSDDGKVYLQKAGRSQQIFESGWT
jgi:hypothetical protein